MADSSILQIIQASTAPVVLISGVGLLLLTLTNRLGRIVDRTRLLAAERRTADAATRPMIDAQLVILANRARLVRLAVALGAVSIALIGVLITVLFAGLLFGLDVTVLAAALFIVALLALVAAMLVFVRELLHALDALQVSLTDSGGPRRSP